MIKKTYSANDVLLFLDRIMLQLRENNNIDTYELIKMYQDRLVKERDNID